MNSLEKCYHQKNDIEQELDNFFKEIQMQNEGTQKQIVLQQKQESIQNSLDLLEKNIQEVGKSSEKEAHFLQQSFQELKDKYSTILHETREGTKALKESVETTYYGSHELVTYQFLEGTPLKNTMLSVLSHSDFSKYHFFQDKSPEQRLEYIFRKINMVLAKFYARKLNLDPEKPLPEYLTKVLLPATERFLMDILKQNGNEANVNFLGNMANFNLENLGSLVMDVNAFSKKFVLPFTQGKALLQFSDFIALPKNASFLKQLKDPYECYVKVLKNPLWSQEFLSGKGSTQEGVSPLLETITWEQFGLSSAGTTTPEQHKQHLEDIKLKFQKEIGTTEMVNSPATVKKLLGILEKTDTFFDKTQALNQKLLDKMDVFGNAAQSVKSVFGIDMWQQLKKIPLLGGILNFVLGILGFSGGLNGLEKARKKRNLDKHLTSSQKEYITEVYSSYMENKKIEETTAQEVIEHFKLEIPEKETQKFAIDIPSIKKQILEKIHKNPTLINPSVLSSFEMGNFKGSDFVYQEESSRELKIKDHFGKTEQEEFVELYLESVLHHVANRKNSDFLSDIDNADTLAFMMVSGVVLKRDQVVEGMKAEIFLPSQFYEKHESKELEEQENIDSPLQSSDNESPEKISQPEEKTQKVNIPEKNPSKEIPTLAEHLAQMIGTGESGGRYGAVNKNDKGAVSLGVLQRHGTRAVDLLKKLKAKDETLFTQTLCDPLFEDIDKAGISPWNDTQKQQFQTLMKKSQFQKVMKDIIKQDTTQYLSTLNKRGIKDPQALLTFGRIYNAGPQFAKRIFNTMQQEGKNVNDYEQVIESFRATEYGKKYKLFDHANRQGITLAQEIGKVNSQEDFTNHIA